jgi:hypothetical protein
VRPSSAGLASGLDDLDGGDTLEQANPAPAREAAVQHSLRDCGRRLLAWSPSRITPPTLLTIWQLSTCGGAHGRGKNARFARNLRAGQPINGTSDNLEFVEKSISQSRVNGPEPS